MAKKPSIKISTRYDRSRDVGIEFTQPTLTKQAFKNESDINSIVAQAFKNGFIPTPRQGIFSDVTLLDDYQAAANLLNDVDDTFYSLPAELRRRFSDSPEVYLEFVTNPANYAACIDLGIFASQRTGDELQASIEAKAPVEQPSVSEGGSSE